MRKATKPIDPETATVEQLAEMLNELRLDRRLTYRELADEINSALALEKPLSLASVQKFIADADGAERRDTTIHPIRKFLVKLHAAAATK